MRTYTILTLFALAVLSFSSCKKEDNRKTYTCVCTGGFGGTSQDKFVKANDDTEAAQNCKALSSPANVNDGIECKLK